MRSASDAARDPRLDVEVDARLAELPVVHLDGLPEATDLQRRFDAKYLVPLVRLPELVDALAPTSLVLEVLGRRTTSYTSVYFDTDELLTFTDHLKGRRRRFKVRTRRYGDAEPLLEVKYKGARTQTVKQRFLHTAPAADVLDDAGLAQIRAALADQYPHTPPERMQPVLTTRYRRTTLVDLVAGERVTIDRGLQITGADGETIDLGGGHAIVEVKSASRSGAAHAQMRSLGLRPDRLSKYCLGVTAVRPEVRGNPWLPALRKLEAADASAIAAASSADEGMRADVDAA